MGFSKMYTRGLSRVVLVLLSCAIANAQSPPLEIRRVPYELSIAASSAPKTDTSRPPEGKQDQTAAKPGSVIGTVLDQTGSVAAGVVVRVTSEDKSFSQKLVTGDNGQFSLSNVPPGRFKLSVSADGFGNQEFSGELTSAYNVGLAQRKGNRVNVVHGYGASWRVQDGAASVRISSTGQSTGLLGSESALKHSMLCPGHCVVERATCSSERTTRLQRF